MERSGLCNFWLIVARTWTRRMRHFTRLASYEFLCIIHTFILKLNQLVSQCGCRADVGQQRCWCRPFKRRFRQSTTQRRLQGETYCGIFYLIWFACCLYFAFLRYSWLLIIWFLKTKTLISIRTLTFILPKCWSKLAPSFQLCQTCRCSRFFSLRFVFLNFETFRPAFSNIVELE